MMLGGFAAIIVGDFVDGLWIVVLGWFIRSGAETSLRQTVLGETMTGVTLGNVMSRNVLTVPPDITLQQVVNSYFLVHPHGGYPVTQDSQILGLITLQSVQAVPKERWESETVRAAMIPFERTANAPSNLSVLDAMHRMARERSDAILVVEGGRLLGIVTRGDLIKAIRTREELELRTPLGPTPTLGSAPVGQVRYCVQCGGQLSAGIVFCPFCGTKQP
jgi:CBS domain-containing protein